MFDFTGTESNIGFENGFDMGGTMNETGGDGGSMTSEGSGAGSAHDVSFKGNLNDTLAELDSLKTEIAEAYKESGGREAAMERSAQHYADFRSSLEEMKDRIMAIDDPEVLRRMSNRLTNEAELFEAREHERQLAHEHGEIERAFISDMTPEQYRTVERLGLEKVDTTGLYPRVTTDFTDGKELYKVNFDGSAYKIIDGTSYKV